MYNNNFHNDEMGNTTHNTTQHIKVANNKLGETIIHDYDY